MSLQATPRTQLDPASLDWLGAVVSQQRADLVARWDAASLAAVQPVASAPFLSVAAGRVGGHWYYVTLGCAVARARDTERPGLLPELTIRIPATEPAPPAWPALVLWDVAARGLPLERDTVVPYQIAACPDVVALALSVDRGFVLPVMSPVGLIKPLQLVGLTASEAAVAQSWNVASVLVMFARVDRNMLMGPRLSIVAMPELADELGAAVAAEVDPARALAIPGLDWDLTDEHSAAISLSHVWCALLASLVKHRLGNHLPLRLAHDGRELLLQPADATGWSVEGDRLVLGLARASAQQLAAELATAASRIELAGVPLIVVLP